MSDDKGTSAGAGKTATVKRADLLATKRPADTARLFGVDGKRLRDKLRKASVYVSKGDAYTDDHRLMLAESFGVTVK